jgi:serine/threonine protein kinase
MLTISQLLEGDLLEGELGNSVYQIGHFQSIPQKLFSHNYGVNLMEQADGTLDELFKGDKIFERIIIKYGEHTYLWTNPAHRNIIISMLLLQISNTLQKVSDELGMIHGDLKAGNIFYSFKESYMTVSYPLNKDETIKIKTNIRLKIADYGKSSIIYKGVRFYGGKFGSRLINASKMSQYTVIETPTEPPTEPPTEDYLYLYDYSKMDMSLGIMHVDLRHVTCPYFRSIDLYCVIISLAIQSPIFMEFCELTLIGKSLFVEKENPFPNLQIPSKRPESITAVFEILNHKQLNCQAIEKCIECCIKEWGKLTEPNSPQEPAGWGED